MPQGLKKFEMTSCRRYHNTLLNKIGSDRTSKNIDGFMHSVFAESPTLFQLNDSDTQNQTIKTYINEVNPVLIRWWLLYVILLLCSGTACFITLLSYTKSQHIV